MGKVDDMKQRSCHEWNSDPLLNRNKADMPHELAARLDPICLFNSSDTEKDTHLPPSYITVHLTVEILITFIHTRIDVLTVKLAMYT